MGLPPVFDGAVHVSSACLLPGVTVKPPGADDWLPAVGVAEADAVAPGPALLTARTKNVYLVPFVRFVRMQSLGLGLVSQVAPLSCDTSYLMIALPPVFEGAVHASDTSPLPGPGVAVKFRGAVGTAPGDGEGGVVPAPTNS
jgi:hypothetical protein